MNIISNSKNKRKVIKMNYIEDNYTVAQHNDLIKGVAKMDLIPLKIFELCVSAIDVENPPKDNTIYLSKEELFNFFDVTSGNKHTRFKEAIERLQKQAIFQIKQVDEKGKEEYMSIVPIPTVKWNNFNDLVTIKFNEEIMPYLINLSGTFTQYLIWDIANLKQKNSVVLFKWFTMNYNIFERYSNFKNKNPYIEITELRKITDTVKTYERFSNFEKWVLKEPIKEINENTHFKISYDKVKKGRSIVGIKFYIDTKPRNVSIPEIYERSEERSKKEDFQVKLISETLPEALKNKYIIHLLKRKVLNQNNEDIVNVYLQIIPIYEDIDSQYYFNYNGKDSAVLHHIDHISSYIIDTKASYHSNITKYLKTAVDSYKVDLKNNRIMGVETKDAINNFDITNFVAPLPEYSQGEEISENEAKELQENIKAMLDEDDKFDPDGKPYKQKKFKV